MDPSRRFVRGSLVLLLAAACVALSIAPLLLRPANAAPKAQVSASNADIVISEFRFRGDGGEDDEFIELFNRSCSAVDLRGWTVELSNAGTTGILLFGFSTTQPVPVQPGHYYLLASTTYDQNPPVAPEDTFTPGISSANGGIALFKPGSIQPVDQVGFNIDGYSEGSLLAPLSGNQDRGYSRKVVPSSGMYVDTNDNAEDFALQSPSQPQNAADTTGTCGIPTQTISGNVGGLAGVTLTYTDGTEQTVTSKANGDYTITVPSNWSGTVTPSKPTYAFTPDHRTYTNLLVDQTGQDYSPAVVPPTKTPVPGPRSVVINEIGWGGTQESSDDQWIELYNPNTWDIDLTDWQLVGANNTIGTNGVLNLKGTIPARGFFIVQRRSDVFQNLPAAAETQVDTHLSLSKTGETLYLRTTELIDTANLFSSRWFAGRGGSGVSASNRASMERHSPTGADVATNWYTFAGPESVQTVRDRGGNRVKGTPGQPNWAFAVTATPSPVPTKYKTPTPRPPTPFAHMVINEFLPRAGSDWNRDETVDVFDEFIEIKNLGPIDGDLKGWRLDIISPAGNRSFTLPTTQMKTDQRAVFYGKTTGLSLYDSGGTVRLINTRGVVIDARSYDPVQRPDEAHCRIPDGYYWRFPCFPTPGNENSLTGVAPAPPPIDTGRPPPCLMADTVPEPFREAECNGFGANMYNASYWDNQSGFQEFLVPDALNKGRAIVK